MQRGDTEIKFCRIHRSAQRSAASANLISVCKNEKPLPKAGGTLIIGFIESRDGGIRLCRREWEKNDDRLHTAHSGH